MTNFSGSNYDIVLISDYTDTRQNKFLIELIETYFPQFRWREDRCGYACSDHASWFRNGFPVSFPFESSFKDHNNNIHTEKDTIDVSNNHAFHAKKFAQLTIAYLIEMASLK